MKEATARIKINKLLEAAGWRFFAEGSEPANICLEPSVTITTTDLDAFGDDLVNRRSTTWRGLDAAERARDPLDLLVAHPSLMKRPLIAHEGQFHLGWTKEVQAALLG